MNQGWTKLYKEILSGPATLNTRKMYAAFYYETTQRGDGWPKFSLSKLHWASVDTGWLMTVWSVQQREEGGGRGEMRLKQMSPILSFIDWRAHCLTWGLECKRVGCLVKVICYWRLLCCVKYERLSRKTGSEDDSPNDAFGAGTENKRSLVEVVIWKLKKKCLAAHINPKRPIIPGESHPLAFPFISMAVVWLAFAASE